MALRPFAKHQKRKADDDATPSAADEFAQFFSNDPRPEQPPMDIAPPPPVEAAPTVTMNEESAAGWYPDSKDPGLMRYWDGFHLTGQTMRVDPPSQPAAERTPVTPADTTPSPSASELLAGGQPKAPLLGSRLLSTASATPVEADVPVPAEAAAAEPVDEKSSDDETATPPTASTDEVAVTPPSGPVAPSIPSAPSMPLVADTGVKLPPAPAAARMTSPPVATTPEPTSEGWVERTEQAVTKAQSVGTPEAWQEAADAAAVVAEMALTMQVAADVRRSAEQLAEAAGEAKQREEEAQELAAEAQRSVQKTAQAAKEAADAAAAAARAATEAKQKAERALEAMPRVTARSTDASQAASAAKRKAQLVEEIVTKATEADTAEAWRDAHRSAEVAVDQVAREAHADS